MVLGFFSANGAFHISLGRSPRKGDVRKRRAESPFHRNWIEGWNLSSYGNL
jgi:hypothetical protein